ncbi:MAG: hypothetical protein WCR20_02725, partial [Verrucomicrobiota bacterium]
MANWKFLWIALLAGLAPVAGHGQIRIEYDVVPGGTKPVLVSMSGFTGEAAQVIQFDLYVQGFAVTNAEAAQYELSGSNGENLQGKAEEPLLDALRKQISYFTEQLTPVARKLISNWPEKRKAYDKDYFEYNVRDKVIRQEMFSLSLSGTRIPKVLLPKYKDWGDLLK